MSDRPSFNIGEEIARINRALSFRGGCYPVDTESEPYVPDTTTPRDRQHISIPVWLRKCKEPGCETTQNVEGYCWKCYRKHHPLDGMDKDLKRHAEEYGTGVRPAWD